jgi:hypothetical protein
MAAARRRRAKETETVWLQEYANTYLPTDASFSFCPEELRECGLSLVDVREMLRTAVVTSADKLDEPGAIWIAEALADDGREFCLTVHVISEEYDVELKGVEEMSKREDDSNDAA